MGIRILRCKHCGNIVIFQEDSKVTPVCCGEIMQLLDASTEDALIEKHLPVVEIEREEYKMDDCAGKRHTKKGCCQSYITVRVGSTAHPMVDSHYITWIMLKTNLGTYTKFLEAGDEAEATFCLTKGEKAEQVFSYCNLHGLWKGIV